MSIKDIILRKIDSFLYRKMCYRIISFLSGSKYDNLYAPYKGVRKAFLLMEPEYGNLGDHAIAYASEKFIEDNFPEYELITVTEKETCKHIKAIKKVCSQDDLIFIQGGGNMGSLYPYIEHMRRFCIENFPHLRIISMPTSIYYTNDKRGRKEFKRSLKTYNKHKSLFLLARDKYSFDFMKKNYVNAYSKLVPDIVYYLAESDKKLEKRDSDVMICLRAECESAIGTDKRAEIISFLNKALNGRIFIFDTTVWRDVPKKIREVELKSLLRRFSKAKCIVTDRMHGMIFSAITGTPAIVLKSRDGKVLGGYDWIKESEFIELIDSSNPEVILQEINKMNELDCNDDISYLHSDFIDIRRFVLDNERK